MRKPNGRRRIEIARIEDEIKRRVTFSKRRTGLFKKATEICTLCGATVVIVIFGPKNKVYSCGHPSVESIMDKYLGVDPPVTTNALNPFIAAHQNARADKTNKKLNKLVRTLEREKKYGEELKSLRKEPPIEELSLSELRKLCDALEAADAEVERVVNQNKALGIEYPYQTIGSAFAPLRARESTSSDSDDGLSDSDSDSDEGSSDSYE